MVGALLLRGMLVGLFAGLLGFAFLKIVGEPPVERAIAFETTHATTAVHAVHDPGVPAHQASAPEPELVSRAVQAGIGLFTGVAVYSAAFGGLFALAFTLAYGRIGAFDPRATAALLAAAGFVAVYLVPALKYPPNPPSVGEADTIGPRTALYFSMIALSLAAMIAAGMLRNRLLPRLGSWNAALLAGAAFVGAATAVALALPAVDEVPADFPATVLWRFRLASCGGQAILWAGLGFGFGWAAEHVVGPRRGARTRLAAF
jgi:predicted cobalt transporter CbtA